MYIEHRPAIDEEKNLVSHLYRWNLEKKEITFTLEDKVQNPVYVPMFEAFLIAQRLRAELKKSKIELNEPYELSFMPHAVGKPNQTMNCRHFQTRVVFNYQTLMIRFYRRGNNSIPFSIFIDAVAFAVSRAPQIQVTS